MYNLFATELCNFAKLKVLKSVNFEHCKSISSKIATFLILGHF